MADDPALDLSMLGMYGPNTFSNYQGQRLPMPGYVGTPTDAMGKPIQPPPGTTLNSPPAPAPAAPAAPAQSGPNPFDAALVANMVRGAQGGGAGFGNQAAASNQIIDADQMYSLLMSGGGGHPYGQPGAYGQPAAAAPQTAPTAPATGGSLDNALSLLANPGKVTTPGGIAANAPQRPSVLSNFLANNQGGTGAGNYSNQGFFNTLNALKGAPT
jgi:hypothetical protein